MRILSTVAEVAALDHSNKRGAVLTMGALHQGHIALIEACRRHIGSDGILCVSIFVNPTQFSDPQDLEKYPRTLEADVEICKAAGVDVVFTPSVSEIYPNSPKVQTISAGALGEILEGKNRTGHFDGVATVVHRLLEILQADVTCFGQKDFQQIAVVRQMLDTTKLICSLVEVETVREQDGFALSSRNRRLNSADRQKAIVIPQAINAVAEGLAKGLSVEDALEVGIEILNTVPEVVVDYLTVRSMQLDKPPMNGPARVLIAAHVGGVRLIDNCAAAIVSGS
jgi:pantoate--beta-alanine ligase